MSASELKRRLLESIEKEIEDQVHISLSAQWLAPRPNNNGFAVIPQTTAEDIAMNVLEANAFRRGLARARKILIEEHQKLVAPDTSPENAEPLEEETSERRNPIY